MDPITLNILTGLAVNYFADFTAPVVKSFFTRAFSIDPSLEQKLKEARSTTDFEEIFKEAVGLIDAEAGTGEVNVDRAFLEALRGIRFDHENGGVIIKSSQMRAPVLQVGGTGNGQTKITGSVLKAGGSQFHIGQNAEIKITGNAQIRMS